MNNKTRKESELMLVLKFGSMPNAYEEWRHDFDAAGFTQDESDYIAIYAKETNRSTGVFTYDYQSE